MGFLSDNFISDFFVLVLKWVDALVHNYPFAIIILTIAIRILILPLDLRQKQSTRKMQLIQPKVESLKKRYGNNPQQLQKKQQELYKKEGVRPLAGCLPMLLTLPIFFAFFGAMRVMATEQQVSFMLNSKNLESTEYAQDAMDLPGWLWVNNIWQADSGLEPVLPTGIKFSQYITTNINNVSPQALHMMNQQGLLKYSYNSQNHTGSLVLQDTVTETVEGEAVSKNVSPVPVYDQLITTIVEKNGLSGFNNGWFILPLLAGATLFLQQKMTTGQNPQAAQQQGGKFMLIFFPVFSAWICLSQSAAFSIYWLFANIYAVAQTFVLNLIYKKQDEKAKQGVIEEAT